MQIKHIRFSILLISFIVLTYGGRWGINTYFPDIAGKYPNYIGRMLPTFSCPYVDGRVGGCYLMPFQKILSDLSITDYQRTFGWPLFKGFLFFSLFYLLLGRIWCGWICPLGFIQDILNTIRSFLKIPYLQFSRKTTQQLKIIKYIVLAATFLICFFMANSFLGYEKISPDYNLPFCQVCPAKAIMPLFEGNRMHLTMVTLTNSTTFMTGLAMVCTALFIAGSFWIRRFFCRFCPMLALMNLFGSFSLFQFKKNVNTCAHCESCALACPMDIRKVTKEREKEIVLDDACILCGSCIDACAYDDVLNFQFFKKTIFKSSREKAIKG